MNIKSFLFLLVFALLGYGIKAQHINLYSQSTIDPPHASQDGSANLNYPLSLPSGLNGMTPIVSVHYNSDAGNSWMGIGWNIGLPAIYLDTRWGVPRFDPVKESELYSLFGEQLMYPDKFLPHRHKIIDGLYSTLGQERNEFVEGTGDSAIKTFQPRRKETYMKIERIGNSPSNYYWKVSNIDGSISWFGGDENGLDNAYVRKTNGNIAFWALKKRVDSNGYFIKYEYQEGSSPTGNLVGGIHLYLKKIIYTGLQKINGNTVQNLKEPMHEVVFDLDNGNTRLDKFISARYGYKDVVIHRLSQIRINELYNGSMSQIRKYVFTYANGAFGKTVLKKIDEFKNLNERIFTYNFGYYESPIKNENGNIFVPLTISAPSINTNMLLDLDTPLKISRIGTTENSGIGGEINVSAGAGILWQNMSPGGTFINIPLYDLKMNFTSGKTNLIDINGDGLLDILYKDNNGQLKFYENTCSDCKKEFRLIHNPASNISFGSSKDLVGVNHFLKGEGEQRAGLINGLFGFSMEYLFAKFGVRNYKSKSRLSHYLLDANGDLLPDFVVKNGDTSLVYFNHIDSNGKPTFTTSSQPTENMLIVADIINPEGDADFEYQEEEPELGYDAVKVIDLSHSWPFPMHMTFNQLNNFNVNVSLDNPVEIGENESVKVSIEISPVLYSIPQINKDGSQHFSNNPGCQIFSGHLTKENSYLSFSHNWDQTYSCFSNEERIGTIFLRTHYSSNGNYTVNWDLTTNSNGSRVDENDNNYTNFNYQDNFFLSNPNTSPFKLNGTGSITWDSFSLSKPLSDDVILRITKNRINHFGEITSTQNYDQFISSGNTFIPSGEINNLVLEYDEQSGVYTEIVCKIISTSNLNWAKILWRPKIEYNGQSTLGNTSGEMYLIPKPSVYWKINQDTSKYFSHEYSHFINTDNEAESIRLGYAGGPPPSNLNLKLINNNDNIGSQFNGKIYLVIKRNSQLIAKRVITILNGYLSVNNTSPIILDYNNYDVYTNGYYLSFSVNDEIDNNTQGLLDRFMEYYSSSGISSTEPFTEVIYPINYLKSKDYAMSGIMYLGNGQFFYNPKLANSNTPVDSEGDRLIDISALNASSLYTSIMEIISSVGDPEDYGTPEEYEQAILDALGLNEDNPIETGEIEDYLTGLGITTIDDLWELLSGMNQCILPAIPFRKKEGNEFIDRWIGLHEDMYVDKSSAKAGKLDLFNGPFGDIGIGDPEPEIFDPQQADLNTGMSSISLYGTGKYKSKRLFIWSESAGHNNYSTRFVDLNGDRYPEIIHNNKIYYTTMTGGQKNGITSIMGNSPLEYIESDVQGISIARTFNSSDISNLKDSSGESRKEQSEENGDQNNSVARVGLSNDDLDGDIIQKDLWLDINGDGFTDWIKNDGGTYKIYYSMGQAMDTTPVIVNAGYSPPNTSPEGGTGISVGGGLGGILGQIGDIGVSGLIDISVGGSFSQSNVKVHFVDINNDGLIDFIYENNGKIYIRYNLGNAFAEPEILADTSNQHFSTKEFGKDTSVSANITIGAVIPWNFMIWIIPAYVKAGAWMMMNGNITSSEVNKSFKDFNGDGFPDLIIDRDNGFLVYYSKMGQVNKLKNVNNSLGRNGFNLNYIPVGNTYDMPVNKWVLNNVEDFYSDGESSFTNRFYEYKNGYYDRREREFYGFELVKSFTSVKSLEQANSMSESAFRETIEAVTINKFYNKSYYLGGKLKEQYIIKNDFDLGSNLASLPSSRIHSTTKRFYSLKPSTPEGLIDISATGLPENYDVGGTEGRGTAAALLQKTETKVYEYSATPIITTTEYMFDGYKRLQSQKNVEEDIMQEFYYPDELLSEPFMEDLINDFRLNIPVKSETKESNVTLATQLSGFENNASTQNQLRLVSQSGSKDNNPIEVKFTIDLYDDSGNILQQSTPEGTPVSIIWGYNDRYPVATIQGLSYNELPASVVNQIRSISSTNPEDETTLLSKINELRTHSSVSGKGLVTAYTYYPNTGIRSLVSSTGMKTRYTYYPNGKLKEVIDNNGKIIQEFKYHYYDTGLND